MTAEDAAGPGSTTGERETNTEYDPDAGNEAVDGWVVRRDALDGMSLDVAIPGAVASHTGVNVLTLDPLSEAIDVDALEGLWHSDGGGGRQPDVSVTFRYMSHEVTVTGDELRLAAADDEGGDSVTLPDG